MTNNREPDKIYAFMFVAVQAVILVLLIFTNLNYGIGFKAYGTLGNILEWVGIIGIIVSAYSIRSSLTPMPIPKEEGKLAVNGLFRYVRHPMYTSVLVFSLGLAVSNGKLYKYLLVLSLLILFYYKSKYEEIYLTEKYPEYKNYARRTSRFIPGKRLAK